MSRCQYCKKLIHAEDLCVSYKIEDLEQIFTKHSHEAEKQRSDIINRHKKQYGSDSIPEHLLDPFNLPSALLSIIQEIRLLKTLIEALK